MTPITPMVVPDATVVYLPTISSMGTFRFSFSPEPTKRVFFPRLREQHFPFMRLPAELRVQIYEHLVVVGKVFYTPDRFEITEGKRFSSVEKYAKPAVHIFRVCKQMFAEAEDVYLTRNLFVLPPMFMLYTPFRQGCIQQLGILPADVEAKDRPLFSHKGLRLVRNISVGLCARGPPHSTLSLSRSDWTFQNAYSQGEANSFPSHSFEFRMAYAHTTANERLASQWSNLLRALTLFTATPTANPALSPSVPLNYVEIDFQNSFCSLGCCRMVYAKPKFIQECKVREVRVLGCLGNREEAWLLDIWSEKLGINQQEMIKTFGIRFNGKDKWEEKFIKTEKKADARRAGRRLAAVKNGAPQRI